MHFIGIGGVGMSAVARIMVARGVPVTGSDAKDLPVMADLAAAGAGSRSATPRQTLATPQTVVAGSAIRAGQPRTRGRPCRRAPRAPPLRGAGRNHGGRPVVTVAGTHGKSTTTSMITVLLQGAGLDPSFAIGANVPALGVNAATAAPAIFVAEADESDGSFLNYRPQIAVVTNVEPDHLDYYGTAEAVYASFDRFTALLPADGVLVACADDAGAAALAERTARTRQHQGGPLRHRRGAAGPAARRTAPAKVSISTPAGRFALELQVPGRHNALNAAAAFAVALELGVEPEAAAAALAHFSGASRRFEFKGERPRRPRLRRLRPPPHRSPGGAGRGPVRGRRATRCTCSSSRTCFPGPASLPREFADALNAADTALVLDIYPAREDPIPGSAASSSQTTWAPAAGSSARATQAVAAVVAAAAPGDIVLTAGAGDVTAYGPLIVEALHGGGRRCLAPAGPRTRPAARGPSRQGADPGAVRQRPRSVISASTARAGRRTRDTVPGSAPDNVLSFPEPKGKRPPAHPPGARIGILAVLVAGLLAAAVYSPVLALRTVTVDGHQNADARAGPDGARAAAGQTAAPGQRRRRQPRSSAPGPGQGRHAPRRGRRPRCWSISRERVPVALVKQGESFQLVDVDGVQLGTTADPASCRCRSSTAARDASARICSRPSPPCWRALPADVLAKLSDASAKSVDAVELKLVDGQTIVWGNAGEKELKAKVLEALLKAPADPKNPVRVYDVSVPRHPVTR